MSDHTMIFASSSTGAVLIVVAAFAIVSLAVGRPLSRYLGRAEWWRRLWGGRR